MNPSNIHNNDLALRLVLRDREQLGNGLLLLPITRGANSAMNQSEFLAITYNLLKGRENITCTWYDWFWICFSLVEKLGEIFRQWRDHFSHSFGNSSTLPWWSYAAGSFLVRRKIIDRAKYRPPETRRSGLSLRRLPSKSRDANFARALIFWDTRTRTPLSLLKDNHFVFAGIQSQLI